MVIIMSSCVDPDTERRQIKPVSSKKKSKSPYRWLWMIPIQLIILVLSIPIGLRADMMFWQYKYITRPPDAELGHGLPVFTIIVPLLGVGMTIVITVLSVIITVIAVYRRWKRNSDC